MSSKHSISAVFKPYEQQQLLLLPPSLEELIAANHPARIVNTLLNKIDSRPLLSEYCEGAEKAITIRGLPEMSIKGIHLNDLILNTKKGVDIVEAEDISLANVTVKSEETNPVIHIDNGSNVTVRNFKFAASSSLFFGIEGSKSKAIKLSATDTSAVGKVADFCNEATEQALIISK